jgi:succinate dehydrogenase / fumarate reductase, iron-sulfur subunit
MREFKDGDEIFVEPWRARAFPVSRTWWSIAAPWTGSSRPDGYVSVSTGGVVDAHAILIPKEDLKTAMDAAECIGCGACVAACPNRFRHAVRRFQGRPPGQPSPGPPRSRPARLRHDRCHAAKEGFGNCSNHYECEAACPKGISVKFIAQLNREYLKALPGKILGK